MNYAEVAMEIRLTEKQEEILRELLQEHHKHLLHEINKAHHRDFKITLRNRCAIVEAMVEKLQSVHSA
jgi:vacuolar-type H+-ATPase subunit E/Vma4